MDLLFFSSWCLFNVTLQCLNLSLAKSADLLSVCLSFLASNVFIPPSTVNPFLFNWKRILATVSVHSLLEQFSSFSAYIQKLLQNSIRTSSMSVYLMHSDAELSTLHKQSERTRPCPGHFHYFIFTPLRGSSSLELSTQSISPFKSTEYSLCKRLPRDKLCYREKWKFH